MKRLRRAGIELAYLPVRLAGSLEVADGRPALFCARGGNFKFNVS